ncbi:MAG: hypothetical protein IKL73_05275 [Lachnospiraceae bacterium]|nr:hypothetical protein [Lachnospiraceae bacterium]
MEYVKSYLIARGKKLLERKNLLLAQKNRILISIENVDKTITKLKENENTNSDIFFASSHSISENNFGNTTIKKLKDEYVKLETSIEPIDSEIDEIDNELKDIKYAVDELAKKPNTNENTDDKHDGLKVIEVQEYERQRIARDMHDSIIQKLTSMIHKSELCQALLDRDAMRTKLELEVLANLAHTCVDEIRNIICDLRPMAFDDLGFAVVIKRMLLQYDESSALDVELSINEEINLVNKIIAITLYRILQEACNNSIKYSNGTKMKVILDIKDNNIILIHEDDGVGINPDSNATIDLQHGLGLAMMKERVQLLSGKINITSGENGVGTRIEVIVPIDKEN